jgi:hypothetical protein
MRGFLRRHRALLFVLALAWILRLGLVFRGGPGCFGDESRYGTSLAAANLVLHGEIRGGIQQVWVSHGHVGFVILMVPVALVECLHAPPRQDFEDEELLVPAIFLATVSVACLGLVYALSLALGAEAGEALLATVLAAASTTLLYWARHISPYDAALALELAGLVIGIGKGREVLRAFLAGAMTSCGLLVYYGSWYLTASVLLGCLLIGRKERRASFMTRGAAVFLGGIAVTVPLELVASAAGVPGVLFSRAWSFSGTINQGSFDEGWILPWEYLWHAEHGLLVVFAVGAAILVAAALREGIAPHRGALAALAVAGATYGLLVLASNVAHKMVVYGRTSRVLVPFLCIATAHAIIIVFRRRPSRVVAGVFALGLLLHTVWSFAPVLLQVFPRDVRRKVEREHGPFAEWCTLAATQLAFPGEKINPSPASRWLVVNGRIYAAIQGTRPSLPGAIVFETPHPQAWLPYVYEGQTAEDRAVLQRAHLTIQVLDRGTPPRSP